MIPILYSEVNVLCILFLLLIDFRLRKGMYRQNGQRIFHWVLLSNCFLFALDALWIFADSRSISVSIAANWTLNLLYYICSGAVGFIWFLYSENAQQSPLVRDKSHIALCALPMLLLAALSFSSIKTGWMFTIDMENTYHRGPLYILQLIFSYGYIVFTAVKALALSRSAVSYAKKAEYRTLAGFVVAPILAGTLQVFFPGIAILCVGTTFGALYVFINLQERQISVDALTGLNNRNKLMQYLTERMAHANFSKKLFLIMADLDFFKSINDGYGHVEGDNALRKTAEALKGCCHDRHHFIARYGGDEFAIVCEMDNEKAVEDLCVNIADALRKKSNECPYKLSLSMGWAEYQPEMKTDLDFIRAADARLYQAKQARRKSYDTG